MPGYELNAMDATNQSWPIPIDDPTSPTNVDVSSIPASGSGTPTFDMIDSTLDTRNFVQDQTGVTGFLPMISRTDWRLPRQQEQCSNGYAHVYCNALFNNQNFNQTNSTISPLSLQHPTYDLSYLESLSGRLRPVTTALRTDAYLPPISNESLSGEILYTSPTDLRSHIDSRRATKSPDTLKAQISKNTSFSECSNPEDEELDFERNEKFCQVEEVCDSKEAVHRMISSHSAIDLEYQAESSPSAKPSGQMTYTSCLLGAKREDGSIDQVLSPVLSDQSGSAIFRSYVRPSLSSMSTPEISWPGQDCPCPSTETNLSNFEYLDIQEHESSCKSTAPRNMGEHVPSPSPPVLEIDSRSAERKQSAGSPSDSIVRSVRPLPVLRSNHLPGVAQDTETDQPFPTSNSRRDRRVKDNLLVQLRRQGISYREIRVRGEFGEAESTLRGRYRTLTKRREQRVRKPEWQSRDIYLLQKGVKASMASSGETPSLSCTSNSLSKISWKQIGNYIIENGGSYHFGNATCKKKWLEIQGH